MRSIQWVQCCSFAQIEIGWKKNGSSDDCHVNIMFPLCIDSSSSRYIRVETLKEIETALFFRFVTLCFSYDGLQRVWNELAKRFRHFNNAHIFCVCLVSSRPQVSITNYSHWIITFNLQFYGTFRMVRRFRAVTLIEIFYLVVPFKHFNYYLFIICYDRALLVIFSWLLFFCIFIHWIMKCQPEVERQSNISTIGLVYCLQFTMLSVFGFQFSIDRLDCRWRPLKGNHSISYSFFIDTNANFDILIVFARLFSDLW